MEKMNKILVHLYLKIIVMFVFLSLKKVCSFFFLHKSFEFFRAVHGIMAELDPINMRREEKLLQQFQRLKQEGGKDGMMGWQEIGMLPSGNLT